MLFNRQLFRDISTTAILEVVRDIRNKLCGILLIYGIFVLTLPALSCSDPVIIISQ